MKNKLKHSDKKCWACKRQSMINKECRDLDFGIEFDFFKDRGEIIPIISYTAQKKDKNGKLLNVPLRAPFEVEEYTRNSAINLIPSLSKNGVRDMILQAKSIYDKYEFQ